MQRHGIDAAREVAEFELSHIKALQDVIRAEKIEDCDFLLTRNVNVYLNQNRGNETKRAIEKLREMGCGFVDDIFVVDDKDAEAVCPLIPSYYKMGFNEYIDLRSQRRKNSVFIYGRLNMAL